MPRPARATARAPSRPSMGLLSSRLSRKLGSSTGAAGAGAGMGAGAAATGAGAAAGALASAAGTAAAGAAGADAAVAAGAADAGASGGGATVTVTPAPAAAALAAAPAGLAAPPLAAPMRFSSLMFLESSAIRVEASLARASCAILSSVPPCTVAFLDRVSLSDAAAAGFLSSTWVCTWPLAERSAPATCTPGATPASLLR